MKRLTLLIALLFSMVILVACVGPSPRPVIIKDGKVMKGPPEGLLSTIRDVLE